MLQLPAIELPAVGWQPASSELSSSKLEAESSIAEAMTMNLNPTIFKAYDVRGVYPGEVNEDGGARDWRGVRRLPPGQAHRGRARHAPVVARPGRGVHRRRHVAGRRRGRLRHDCDRHAVLRGRAGSARRRRRDHRLPQPGSIQRHQDGPAGGVPAERRRGHLRHPRHDRGGSPAAAGGDPGPRDDRRRARRLRGARDVVHRSRRSSGPSTSCSTPAAAWAGWSPPGCSIASPAGRRGSASRSTAGFPITKPTR